jgi:hypothetical protein
VREAAPVTQSAFCSRSQPLSGHKDWGRLQQSLTKNTEISRESRGDRPCSNMRVTGPSR